MALAIPPLTPLYLTEFAYYNGLPKTSPGHFFVGPRWPETVRAVWYRDSIRKAFTRRNGRFNARMMTIYRMIEGTDPNDNFDTGVVPQDDPTTDDGDPNTYADAYDGKPNGSRPPAYGGDQRKAYCFIRQAATDLRFNVDLDLGNPGC